MGAYLSWLSTDQAPTSTKTSQILIGSLPIMLRAFVISMLIGFSTAILQSTRRPFELVLEIHENSTCSVVSVRQTQHHKGLSDQPGHYVIERSRKFAAHLNEELRVFAFDQEVFRELGSTNCTQARSTRDDIAWDEFTTSSGLNGIAAASQQTVMSKIPVDGVDWNTRVPPLHIERLIESGPSNNRIDLVFFGDGCAYVITCTICVLLSEISFCLISNLPAQNRYE
jgi:hypothetical protein